MKQSVKGALLTAGGGVCWGLSGSMGQYLFTKQGMDAHWLVPIRLFLAGVILFIYCRIRMGKYVYSPWKTKRDARDLLVYGLLGISLCQYLYFRTIQLSTAGAATILQDLSPVMILIVECIHRHEKPGIFDVFSIILALVGVTLITTHGRMELGIPAGALLCGVLCAGCVTVYNCYPRYLLAHFPVVVLQAWSFLMGGLLFAFVFKIWQYNYVPNVMGIIGIAFVVVVGNVLAFTMYMQGVKEIGPEKGILYGFAEPVTAAIVTGIMGTPFTVGDFIGFVCVFAMLVMISLSRQKQQA